MTRRVSSHNTDSAYARQVRQEMAERKNRLAVADINAKLKLRRYTAPERRESDLAIWASQDWMG